MRVHWTDRAKARLHVIREYIAKDSPTAASREVEKILRRSWKLGDGPDIGHDVEGYEDTELREVLVRPYRLIYWPKPEQDQVDVVSVLHYRQLLPGDLYIP